MGQMMTTGSGMTLTSQPKSAMLIRVDYSMSSRWTSTRVQRYSEDSHDGLGD